MNLKIVRLQNLLYEFRHMILLIMLITAVTNAFLRFIGDWNNFCQVLILQAWFAQGFYCYVSRRKIAIAGGGSLDRGDSNIGRTILGSAALGIYLLGFFFEGFSNE